MRSAAQARCLSTRGVDQLRADGDSFNGFTYEVAYEHRLSRRGRLYLTANREIADAADVFSLSQVSDPVLGGHPRRAGGRATDAARWISRELHLGRTQAEFRARRAATARRISTSSTRIRVLTDGQDRKINEFRLGAGYSLGEDTQLHAVAEALRERFANGLRSNDLLFSLNIGRRVTDKVRLEIRGPAHRAQRFAAGLRRAARVHRIEIHVAAAAARRTGGSLRPRVRAAPGARSRPA